MSTQILGEFYRVVTDKGKMSEALSPAIARRRIENYLRSWHILPITPPVVLEAVRGAIEYKLSYFDAQIWAVARLNQIPMILSEDKGFSDRKMLEGIQFVNPYAEGLDLGLL